MVTCGHQFRAIDDADWIAGTSVGFSVGESGLTRKILQQVFKQNCVRMPRSAVPPVARRIVPDVPVVSTPTPSDLAPYLNDSPRRSSQSPVEPSSSPPFKVDDNCLVLRKVNGSYNFDSFDESQHLNGCPLKWFHNKKQSERNRVYRVGRWCTKKVPVKEESRREKIRSLKDKTPVDVKIHKINLLEKYTCKREGDGNSESSGPHQSRPVTAGSASSLEDHRRKLAVKLNRKVPEDDDAEEDEGGGNGSAALDMPEIRYNYLPPRPLLGLKPLLTILLLPTQDTNCCSTKVYLEPGAPVKDDSISSPTLSIKSLDLPLLEERPKPVQPRRSLPVPTSSRLDKKLQIPHQITINLQKASRPHDGQDDSRTRRKSDRPTDRTNGRRKSGQKKKRTLATLFYELRDKTNFRHLSDDVLENLIRDVSLDDLDDPRDTTGKTKRLSTSSRSKTTTMMIMDTARTRKRKEEKSAVKPVESVQLTSRDGSDMNLTCDKVRMYEKRPGGKPRKRSLRPKDQEVTRLPQPTSKI